MNNIQIAELLRNIAAAHQYKDEQKYRFQIIAYNRAADAVEHSTSELKDLWDDGKLSEVPSIGKSIAGHLDELFRTGHSKHFDEIMKGIPPDAFKLMILPKVGIKTAMKMVNDLSKTDLKKILNSAEKLLKKEKRMLLPYAEEVAYEVMAWMKKCPDAIKINVLGSLRRKVATIGDVDISVATKNPERVIKHFIAYPKKQKLIEAGDKTASLLLPGDVQVDVLVTGVENYGNALQHFTGSKFHNIALREFTLKNKLSMNEYRIKNQKTKKEYTFSDEKSLYGFLGMKYIEPELREDAGEIKAALGNKLPDLIQVSDIKSDLQIHSNFNIETSHDLGISTNNEIVKKAEILNYEYIAFTEHNPSKSGHSKEEIVDILMRKKEGNEKLNSKLKSMKLKSLKRVFNSLEIDINKDGSLPVPDKGLELLDFALVSIHSSFEMDKDDMTKRVLSALSHPKALIFAHPTARKLNEREGVELDWEKVFRFCLEKNKWLEINADPTRLDLPDVLVSDAVSAGVKMTLGTDTHEVSMMDNMRYGVYIARRGWAKKIDVINTRSLEEFEKMLQL